MTITHYTSLKSHSLGLVPKDLKQFKKLLNLSKIQDSGRGNHLPVTVHLIGAGLTMLNLSKSQLERDNGQVLNYEGQKVLNKRALTSLFKPYCNDKNLNPSNSIGKKLTVLGKQRWQVCGSALSFTSFSGNLSLNFGASKGCHKASIMALCCQIAQQIHRKHKSSQLERTSKSPFNLLGALVIAKNHKWFIDSTELKQSVLLQENFAWNNPKTTLKQLTSVSKPNKCLKKLAKWTLRMLEIKSAKSANKQNFFC